MFGGRSGLKRVASAAISLALFLVLGGPWVVLQTVAWTKMVIDYSERSSVPEAFSKTFDGNHPCGLCKKITKAKEGERKSPLVITQAKKEGPFLTVNTVGLARPDCHGHEFRPMSAWAVTDPVFRPALPVPRA